MQTYVMKQKNIPLPNEDFDDVIAKRPKQTYFNDILWATTRGKINVVRKQKDVIKAIMKSPNLQKALLNHISTPQFQANNPNLPQGEALKIAESQLQHYCEELCAKMSKSILRTTAWASHKILKRVYDKIIVDMTDLKIIKQLQEKGKNPIILMPTRKSYIDMVLIGYVFFANGLKHPFFSTPSQYLDIRLINRVFKSCGSFYVREHEESELYEAALQEYISILL